MQEHVHCIVSVSTDHMVEIMFGAASLRASLDVPNKVQLAISVKPPSMILFPLQLSVNALACLICDDWRAGPNSASNDLAFAYNKLNTDDGSHLLSSTLVLCVGGFRTPKRAQCKDFCARRCFGRLVWFCSDRSHAESIGFQPDGTSVNMYLVTGFQTYGLPHAVAQIHEWAYTLNYKFSGLFFI